MKRLIYGLRCPFTHDTHYVGKSTQGMTRPMQHLSSSHSEKIKEWVDDLAILGDKPIVAILEVVMDGDNIDKRERYWIQKFIKVGASLLNQKMVTPLAITPIEGIDTAVDDKDSHLAVARFVKDKRRSVNLSQEDFASKAGVALTVVRKIEQGKTNLNLDSLLDVLRMFGCTITVKKII